MLPINVCVSYFFKVKKMPMDSTLNFFATLPHYLFKLLNINLYPYPIHERAEVYEMLIIIIFLTIQ